ncbi:MAG: hypothetical protein ACR650_09880 [Methylocystis sp.]
MTRLLSLLGFLLFFAAPALALQPNPYDAHQRMVIDDGGGNIVGAERPTYRYSGLALTPVATPTDVIQIQGSATKTIRITRIRLTGVATAQGNMPVQIVRRSTAGTAGSAVLTAVTATKLDATDPAATAVVSTVGTANFTTLGTSAGVVATDRINMAAAGTGAAPPALVFDFSAAPLRLRGVSDWIGINLNGAAVPSGGVIDWTIEAAEDNS